MGASGSSALPLKLGRRERCALQGSARGLRGPPRLCGAELATQNCTWFPPGRLSEAENGRQDLRGTELLGVSGSRVLARSPAARTGIERWLQRNPDAEKQPRRRTAAGPNSGERKQPEGEAGGWKGSASGRFWPSAGRKRKGERTHFPPSHNRVPARSPPQVWETGSQAPSDPCIDPGCLPGTGHAWKAKRGTAGSGTSPEPRSCG